MDKVPKRTNYNSMKNLMKFITLHIFSLLKNWIVGCNQGETLFFPTTSLSSEFCKLIFFPNSQWNLRKRLFRECSKFEAREVERDKGQKVSHAWKGLIEH